MDSSQIQSLASELLYDPATLGYSQWRPDAPGKIVELINARTFTMEKTRMVSARTVLAEVEGGAAILDKLEAAAGAVTEVKWAMRFMTGEEGIDIGHPRTRGLLDQLALGEVMTQDDADALKAMAIQPASRAEVLGFQRVTEADVRAALEEI